MLPRTMDTCYQLLAAPRVHHAPGYRGLDRLGPGYDTGEPETSAANRAFLEYSSLWEMLSSPDDAVRLAQPFQEKGQLLDIVGVEIVTGEWSGDVGNGLGFDITWYRHTSLLSAGLRPNPEASADTSPVSALICLMFAHFRPRLNSHGLFSHLEDAWFFLEVVNAISALCRGTWESSGDETFEIVHLTLLQPVG